MKLIDRQIRAVKETLERIIEEYKGGRKNHHWWRPTCPLCITFDCVQDSNELSQNICVFGRLGIYCSIFAKQWDIFNTSLEDIAGFLKSLLISLEEMKNN